MCLSHFWLIIISPMFVSCLILRVHDWKTGFIHLICSYLRRPFTHFTHKYGHYVYQHGLEWSVRCVTPISYLPIINTKTKVIPIVMRNQCLEIHWRLLTWLFSVASLISVLCPEMVNAPLPNIPTFTTLVISSPEPCFRVCDGTAREWYPAYDVYHIYRFFPHLLFFPSSPILVVICIQLPSCLGVAAYCMSFIICHMMASVSRDMGFFSLVLSIVVVVVLIVFSIAWIFCQHTSYTHWLTRYFYLDQNSQYQESWFCIQRKSNVL